MVRESLKKFIGKYPYFFDKNKSSVFYRTSDVNNKSVQRLYNQLNAVYESAHIDKRLYIWREQYEDYDYNINFVANYDDLKEVCVYKGNDLIYHKFYPYTDDEKLKTNTFQYTYTCQYIKKNYLNIEAYQCTDCGTLYFSNEIPQNCTCGNNTYKRLNTYKCNECNEIYFTDKENLNYCEKNNHRDSLNKSFIYLCDECGEVYIGENMPSECNICHTPFNVINTNKSNLNYNDSTITMVDNREDYTTKGNNKFEIHLEDQNGNPLYNATITLIGTNDKYSDTTDPNGNLTLYVNNGEYTLNISHKGYVEDGLQLLLIHDTLMTPTLVIDENTITTDADNYNIEIPIIPNDTFRMTVETWDEQFIVKGYPENDEVLTDTRGIKYYTEFDHDRSLDELGALNNIPRKKYKIVDETLYPHTEPPYNNRETEDDYHYMKRMIEYNLRLWASTTRYKKDTIVSREFIEHYNPVTLELWKMYGIDSQLINRERYLLKVFDENKHPFNEETGLVQCWSPNIWEHKDRFCDGSQSLGEYLFVNADTLNPLKQQNVEFTFNLMNMYGETVESYFTVKLYKFNKTTTDWDLIGTYDGDGNCRFNHNYLEDTGTPTILKFIAYHNDGSTINPNNPTLIVLNTRGINDGDWYVNPLNTDYLTNPNTYVADGSYEHPFIDLQSALDKCTGSKDLIILLNDVSLDGISTVSNNSIIMGVEKSDGTFPVIYQSTVLTDDEDNEYYAREFFKINGMSNTSLILSNVILKNPLISTGIGINSWINSNNRLTDYLYVIIMGGSVILTITINGDYEEFYPFDFLDIDVCLTNKQKKGLSKNNVECYYNNRLIDTYTTDDDGHFSFKFNLDEELEGDYYLKFNNVSKEYVEIDKYLLIHATDIINKITGNVGEYPLLKSESNSTDKVNFYRKGENTIWKTVNVDNNGNAIINNNDSADWELDFNKYLIYTTIDGSIDSKVKDEWIVEAKINLNVLKNKTFIKNLTFNPIDNTLSYETYTITDYSKLQDLDGIVLDVEFNGNNLDVTLFDSDYLRKDEIYLMYSEAKELENGFVDISFNMETGVLEFDRLGDDLW